MITRERMKEIIEAPSIPELGGLNAYSTFTTIMFENKGIRNYKEWDYSYTQKERERIIDETIKLIKRYYENSSDNNFSLEVN